MWNGRIETFGTLNWPPQWEKSRHISRFSSRENDVLLSECISGTRMEITAYYCPDCGKVVLDAPKHALKEME